MLLPKLHQERSVLLLPNDLKVTRSGRKGACKLSMTIDTSFENVADCIVQQHGISWFGFLRDTFRWLNYEAINGVRAHSVEIWDGDVLVAGEIGVTVGAVYTSYTGFYIKDGAGSIQLMTLGRHLHQRGFKLWDLGTDKNIALGNCILLLVCNKCQACTWIIKQSWVRESYLASRSLKFFDW